MYWLNSSFLQYENDVCNCDRNLLQRHLVEIKCFSWFYVNEFNRSQSNKTNTPKWKSATDSNEKKSEFAKSGISALMFYLWKSNICLRILLFYFYSCWTITLKMNQASRIDIIHRKNILTHISRTSFTS